MTEQRLGGPVRFVEIAREVGLIPRSPARRFADETGMTWRAALRRMRILAAIEHLVDDERPITAIAFDVGCTSLSAFNAAFHDLIDPRPRTTGSASEHDPSVPGERG